MWAIKLTVNVKMLYFSHSADINDDMPASEMHNVSTVCDISLSVYRGGHLDLCIYRYILSFYSGNDQ